MDDTLNTNVIPHVGDTIKVIADGNFADRIKIGTIGTIVRIDTDIITIDFNMSYLHDQIVNTNEFNIFCELVDRPVKCVEFNKVNTIDDLVYRSIKSIEFNKVNTLDVYHRTLELIAHDIGRDAVNSYIDRALTLHMRSLKHE